MADRIVSGQGSPARSSPDDPARQNIESAAENAFTGSFHPPSKTSPAVAVGMTMNRDEKFRKAMFVFTKTSSLKEEVGNVLRAEIKAGKRNGTNQRILAEMHACLALLFFDVEDRVEDCLQHCGAAGDHPLVEYILTGLVQSVSSSKKFDNYVDKIILCLSNRDRDIQSRLYSAIASAWLFRFEEPARALEASERALEYARDPRAPTGDETIIAPHVVIAETICSISLKVQQKSEIGETVFSCGVKDKSAAMSAQMISFFSEENDQALVLATDLQTEGADLALLGSGLERQLLLARGATSQDTHIEFLRRRIGLLLEHAPSSAEVNATRYSLAESLERAGEEALAQEIFLELASKTGWSTSVAQLSALRVAYKIGDWRRVVSLLGKLAALAKEEPLTYAYHRLRAEIFEYKLGRNSHALRCWKKISEFRFEDLTTTNNILRLLLDNPKELVSQLLKLARGAIEIPFLQIAIGIVETRLKDMDAALTLTSTCVQTSRKKNSDTLLCNLFLLARLQAREGLVHKVSAVYREIAESSESNRIAVPLFSIASLLEVQAGRVENAIDTLDAATKQSSHAIPALVVLAKLHESTGNRKLLRETLESIIRVSLSEEVRFRALVELGALCISLNDSDGANTAFTSARDIFPNAPELLIASARQHADRGDWALTIESLVQASKNMEAGVDVAPLFNEIGQIERYQRGDLKAAASAHERALHFDSNNLESIRCCQEIYGELEAPEKRLAMFRSELILIEEEARRLAVLLEIGRLSQVVNEPAKQRFDAYREVLTIAPSSGEGLAGLLAAAKSTNTYVGIADALAQAHETSNNLGVLCEGYRFLEDWPRFVYMRLRHIGHMSSAAEQAQGHLEIAEVFKMKLNDTEKEISSYRRALDCQPQQPSVHKMLRRLLEQEKLWNEMADAIEFELDSIPSTVDTEKKCTELLLLAAQVRSERLGADESAIVLYERVLTIDATNQIALNGLEALYKQLHRESDLLRIKVALYSCNETADLVHQIVELRLRTGDTTGAIDFCKTVFKENVSNREMFSILEKLYYYNELWGDVMNLYSDLIAKVESGETTAYRIGDLYLRRGEVQFLYVMDRSAAAASFLRVIETDPTCERAIDRIKEIFSESGDWISLVAAYESRSGLCEDTALKITSLRNAVEIAEKHIADQDETIRLNRALLALEPLDSGAFDALEAHYTETKNWRELVLVLESRLSTLESRNETDLRVLGRLAAISAEKLRDEHRAINYYNKLVEIEPKNEKPLEALARIYESTERWEEFVNTTRCLVGLEKRAKKKALLYFKCGSVTEAKFGDEEKAIRYYKYAIKTSNGCLPAMHGLRDLYLRRKEWTKVIGTLEKEISFWRDKKERAGVLAQIGRIYEVELKDVESALGFYHRALAVDSNCVSANRALFDHFFELEAWDRAETYSRSLRPKAMAYEGPLHRSEFHRKLGVMFKHTRDPSTAARNIAIALEIQPTNLTALQSFRELASEFPNAFDFLSVFRNLEIVYNKQADTQKLRAQVMTGIAQIEIDLGDVDVAQQRLEEAVELSENTHSIAVVLVELYISMRNWRPAITILESFCKGNDLRCGGESSILLSNIYSEFLGDSERAIITLRRYLDRNDKHTECYFLLAQELYCLGRFREARTSIQRVVELVTGPDMNLSAENLARYYYYLGRVFDREGDSRSANLQYRRSAEYDPCYSQPALALAMHSVKSGQQQAAERRLIDTALAAMELGGKRDAVPPQRGLARIFVHSGNSDSAIEAYRGILEVEPEEIADRLFLAGLYAPKDLPRAIDQVRQVIQTELRYAPALRVLAQYYVDAGEFNRVSRVVTAMNFLGFVGEDEIELGSLLEKEVPAKRPVRPLTDEMRISYLVNPTTHPVLNEFFSISYQEIANSDPRTNIGQNLVHWSSLDGCDLQNVVRDMIGLYEIEPEVYVGIDVPDRMILIAHPRPIVVLDETLVEESETCLRFALGVGFEAIKGKYAWALRFGEERDSSLRKLSRQLFAGEKGGQCHEFIASVPDRARELWRQHEDEFLEVTIESWIDDMNAVARRAGLIASDDMSAAVRMLAVLKGESGKGDLTGLGPMFCGDDLFQFYLSEEYEWIRVALSSQ